MLTPPVCTGVDNYFSVDEAGGLSEMKSGLSRVTMGRPAPLLLSTAAPISPPPPHSCCLAVLPALPTAPLCLRCGRPPPPLPPPPLSAPVKPGGPAVQMTDGGGSARCGLRQAKHKRR